MEKNKYVSRETSEKEFLNLFGKLCRTRQNWEAWSDMVRLFAITYANAAENAAIEDPDKRSDRWKKREKEYLQIIRKYKKDEQEVFPQLLGIMLGELERRCGDFLGDMYMKMNLGSHWHGQFFTPQSVAELMAEITADTEKVESDLDEKGFASICDPACGAGVNLLACMKSLQIKKVNIQDRVLFCGQDIDGIAGLMCYIQLAAFGLAGYVCIADTLMNPMKSVDVVIPVESEGQEWWYTPMWYSPVWEGRRKAHRMDYFLRSISGGKKAERQIQTPETEPENEAKEDGGMTLKEKHAAKQERRRLNRERRKERLAKREAEKAKSPEADFPQPTGADLDTVEPEQIPDKPKKEKRASPKGFEGQLTFADLMAGF